MPTKKDFRCNQCGKCCLTYTVKLSNQDIKNIESLGYKKEFFAEPDSFDIKTGKYSLKRKDDKCIFLTKTLNNYKCKIYNKRPIICKAYPFNESDEVDTCIPKKRTIK